MGYTQVALEDKILDMYPEVRTLSPKFRFNQEKDAWIITLKKGAQEQVVQLCKTDADACMDNTYCATFGTEIRDAMNKFK